MAEFEQILEDFFRTSDFQKQLSSVADTVDDYGNQSSSTTATARETIVANNDNSYDLLPEKIRQRVNELQKLNEQKKSTEFRFVEDFFYLIKKYEQMYEPLHEIRAEIVSGMYEPSDSDLPDDYYDNNNNVDINDSKWTQLAGIPFFWLKVLYASEDFSKGIVDADVPILKHLEDIRVATEPSVRRFSIEFYFSPNEYFSNDVIQKAFYLQIDPRLTDLCSPVKVVSTDIDWNADKCHFVERFVDQNTGEEDYRYYDSFFNYFWSSTDELDDVNCLEYDWDVSRVLIQELVPNAVNYFTSDLHIAADHCDKSNEDYEEEEDVNEEDETEKHDIYEDKEEEEGEEEAVNYYDNQNINQSNDYGYYDEEVSDQEVVDVEDDDNNEESKEVDEYQGSEQLYSQNYY
ncbi:uncharacterized protein LOC128955530 [Oppia nitens]|uniref:uncharacterized protein LOC128955530 n=1 Tax=Oppia nitens TaxID=1686743 RepID=UPI0023DCEA23|nr:uncharacterized protein LOC128955530 [Oppia nitens]